MRNLVKRGDIYYIKKRVNGKQIFRSLETSDLHTAKYRLEMYLDELFKARIQAKDELPLPRTQKQVSENKPSSKINIQEISLHQALNEYVLTYQNSSYSYSTNTIKIKNKFASMLRGYEWEIFRDPPKYQEFLQEVRLKHRIGDSYIYKLFNQQLKPFLDFCIKQNYYTEHEKKRLDFPKQPKKKIQRNIMADQDFHRLLNYFKRKADWDFMLYMIFIYQFGNRLNEIPQLKHSHIDLERLSINIPTPKRDKEKILTFSQKFKEIISPLLTHAKVNSPYIFQGHDKHKDYYSHRFKKIRGWLNLNKAYTLRDFRYTAGNRLLEETGDIYKVSGLLGHSKVSTTQESYIAPQKSVHTTIIDNQISKESVASFEFWGMSIALGNPEYTRGLSKFEQQEILLGFLSLSFLHYLDDKGIQRIYEPFNNLEDMELAYRSMCHIDDNIVNICIYTLLELYPKIDKLCKDKKILGYSLYEEIGKASYSKDFDSENKCPTQDVVKIFDELISTPLPINKVQRKK